MPINYSQFNNNIRTYLENQTATDSQDAGNQIADIYVSAWNQGADLLQNSITVQAGPIASGFASTFNAHMQGASGPGTWSPAASGIIAAASSAAMAIGSGGVTINAIASPGVTTGPQLYSAFRMMNASAVASALTTGFTSHVAGMVTANQIGTVVGASNIV